MIKTLPFDAQVNKFLLCYKPIGVTFRSGSAEKHPPPRRRKKERPTDHGHERKWPIPSFSFQLVEREKTKWFICLESEHWENTEWMSEWMNDWLIDKTILLLKYFKRSTCEWIILTWCHWSSIIIIKTEYYTTNTTYYDINKFMNNKSHKRILR